MFANLGGKRSIEKKIIIPFWFCFLPTLFGPFERDWVIVSVNRVLHWFINVTNGLFKFFIKNAFVYLLLLRLVPICSWIVPRIRPETDKSSCGCITLMWSFTVYFFEYYFIENDSPDWFRLWLRNAEHE